MSGKALLINENEGRFMDDCDAKRNESKYGHHITILVFCMGEFRARGWGLLMNMFDLITAGFHCI